MTVIKCGGSSLAKLGAGFASFVAAWQQREPVILVHGGGPAIAKLEKELNLKSDFNAKGQRITNDATLEVVVQCLSGSVNVHIVTLLTSAGLPAFGLSGCDGGLLRARLKDYRELGWVGEITAVRADLLQMLCQQGFLPVVAPVSICDTTFETEIPVPPGQLLNVNADGAASAIAAALGAQNIVFVSDIPGILDAKKRVLPQVSAAEIRQLIESGVIYGGMVAKVEAAIELLEDSRKRASALDKVYIIDGTSENLAQQQKPDADFRQLLQKGTCIYL